MWGEGGGSGTEERVKAPFQALLDHPTTHLGGIGRARERRAVGTRALRCQAHGLDHQLAMFLKNLQPK